MKATSAPWTVYSSGHNIGEESRVKTGSGLTDKEESALSSARPMSPSSKADLVTQIVWGIEEPIRIADV
jgi:hypothetical protein